MITTQRSQLEAYEKCPRLSYWGYYFEGRGIERRALSVPLLTGSLLHHPLAQVLGESKTLAGVARGAFSINEIVAEAKRMYLEAATNRGIQLDYFDGSEDDAGKIIWTVNEGPETPLAWQINEQLALIEALVHGWCRVRLPRLLEEYRIVDVEAEQQVDLGQDVVMLTRRDALLERKQTGELFVLNFKSTSTADKTWVEQWRYDQQTLSEFVAAAASYPSRICRGVLIEGLVKGPRSLVWPKDSEPAQRRHNSPLLYHYAEPSSPPMPPSYSASAYRTCRDSHPWRWAKGGFCPGQKKHKLPDSYQLNMVSQTCGIEEWLDWLEKNDQPTLEAQFVSLPTILRSEFEINRWREQTIHQAVDMDNRSKAAAAGIDMNYCFPMHTGHANCVRPSKCPMLELCWGVGDPQDPAQYLPRAYNHPAEEELRHGHTSDRQAG